jgi:hypothetical protein
MQFGLVASTVRDDPVAYFWEKNSHGDTELNESLGSHDTIRAGYT